MKKFSDAYTDILKDLLDNGYLIEAKNSLSIGANRSYYEILNYGFSILEPNNRLIHPELKMFNIYKAIGRFIWLFKGSNLLSEIEYYDDYVKNFSDDGITIPGSSFGNRIFDSSGVNQFENIVKILSLDRSSRRAAISVYQPGDNNRESKDIPCLFGLFFHIREEKLHATIIMRSNNSLRLLPYNFFELTLFAEILACELGIEAGPVHYHALSMHLYTDDRDQFTAIINNSTNLLNQSSIDIKLNNQESQLKYLDLLIELEERLRRHSTDLIIEDFELNMETYKMSLTNKWFQFYLVLLDFHLIKNKAQNLRYKVKSLITPMYNSYLWV